MSISSVHGRDCASEKHYDNQVGGKKMKFVIVFPEPVSDILLRIAAEQECSVEELIDEAIKEYLERMNKNGN